MTFQHLMKTSLLNKFKELKVHDKGQISEADDSRNNDEDKLQSTIQLTTYAQNGENNSKGDILSVRRTSTLNLEKNQISEISEEKSEKDQNLEQISEEEPQVEQSQTSKIKKKIGPSKKTSLETSSFCTDSSFGISPNNKIIATPKGIMKLIGPKKKLSQDDIDSMKKPLLKVVLENHSSAISSLSDSSPNSVSLSSLANKSVLVKE